MSDYELAALQNALNQGYKRWGNYMYEYDRIMEERMTPENRKAMEEKKKTEANEFKQMLNKAKEEDLEVAKAKNIAQKKKKHFNVKTSTLKRIAKLCKWECQGETCWARNQKMCPYIHKGEPGWNEKHGVKKGGKRRSTRRRMTRRKH